MHKSSRINHARSTYYLPFVLFFCLISSSAFAERFQSASPTKDTAQWSTPAVMIDVKFTNATAKITPNSIPLLDQLAKQLEKQSQTIIKLSAHADELDVDANMKLALSRAQEIKKYLVEKKGIKANRIACEGFGHSKQNSSSKTPALQTKNQRVEIFFTTADNKATNKQEDAANWAKPFILDGVRFSNASDILSNSSLPVLNKLAKDMQERPTIAVKIIGHTSEADSIKSDVKLSLLRAEQIKRYLVEQKSIKPERIVCEGKGSQQPLYTTESDKPKNRRIEVSLRYME